MKKLFYIFFSKKMEVTFCDLQCEVSQIIVTSYIPSYFQVTQAKLAEKSDFLFRTSVTLLWEDMNEVKELVRTERLHHRVNDTSIFLHIVVLDETTAYDRNQNQQLTRLLLTH